MTALCSINKDKLAQKIFCFLTLNQTGTSCDHLSRDFSVECTQRKPFHNYFKLDKYLVNKFSITKSNRIFQTLMTGHLFPMLMNVNTQI